MMTYLFYKTDYLYRSFFIKPFSFSPKNNIVSYTK